MEQALYLYDLYPKTVPAHTQTQLTLRWLDGRGRLEDGKTYLVDIFPMTENVLGTNRENVRTRVVAQDGQVVIAYAFGKEQEYAVRLLTEDGKRLTQLSAYALEPDLYATRPYLGDCHIHSTYSDGQQSPAFVAAAHRREGVDFMAVTDHVAYEGSLRAIEAYRAVPIDLALYPGEEVHLEGNPTHIVNFGGERSVNGLCRDDLPGYLQAVQAIADETACPPGVEPFIYASCVWAYQQIRACGGLAVFCHPHWIWPAAYNVPDAMSRFQFEQRAFDAFELLNGGDSRQNNMQVAFYQQLRAEGIAVPITTGTDAHSVIDGTSRVSRLLVFSPSLRKEDIIASIQAGRSVAVEQLPQQDYRAHGPYRLVSYALFLLREYVPLHDVLCATEGEAMRRYIQGDARGEELLRVCQGQTDELRARYFGHD